MASVFIEFQMKGEYMCFIKSKSSSQTVPKKVSDPVVRHQADASVTKSTSENTQTGYRENIKTSVIGLTDDAVTKKKTLLGE